MRLRVVAVPNDPNADGQVPFGNNENSMPLAHWNDGVVVMLGNDHCPGHVTVFNNGVPTWYDGHTKFTPRVEDWTDISVVVLQDVNV